MNKKKSITPVMTPSAFDRVYHAAHDRLEELLDLQRDAEEVLGNEDTVSDYKRKIRYLRGALDQMDSVRLALTHPDKRVVAVYRRAIA
jgi:mitochondrial fission protein ELM1